MKEVFPNNTNNNIIFITIFNGLTDKILNVRTAQIVRNYCEKELSRHACKSENETIRTTLRPKRYARNNNNKSNTISINNNNKYNNEKDIAEENNEDGDDEEEEN